MSNYYCKTMPYYSTMYGGFGCNNDYLNAMGMGCQDNSYFSQNPFMSQSYCPSMMNYPSTFNCNNNVFSPQTYSPCAYYPDYSMYDYDYSRTNCGGGHTNHNSGTPYISKDDAGAFNMDSGIQNSVQSLKNKDNLNNDNKVDYSEYGQFYDIADVDGDHYISPSEDQALKYALDTNNDGKISNREIKRAENKYENDKEDLTGSVRYMYYDYPNSSGFTLSDKDKGPDLTKYSSSSTSNSNSDTGPSWNMIVNVLKPASNTASTSSSSSTSSSTSSGSSSASVSDDEMNEYWKGCFGIPYQGSVKYTDNGLNDIDNGINKAKQVLRYKGGNNYERVTPDKFGKFSDVIDRGGNGLVSPYELLELEKKIDKGGDGTITSDDMKESISEMKTDKDKFSNDMGLDYYNTKSNGQTLWSKDPHSNDKL